MLLKCIKWGEGCLRGMLGYDCNGGAQPKRSVFNRAVGQELFTLVMKVYFVTLLVVCVGICSFADGANVRDSLNDRASVRPRTSNFGKLLKAKGAKQNTGSGDSDALKQCDADKMRMQGEIDALRAELKGLKSKLDEDEPTVKPTRPRLCCRALTAGAYVRLVYRWKNFAKQRNIKVAWLPETNETSSVL